VYSLIHLNSLYTFGWHTVEQQFIPALAITFPDFSGASAISCKAENGKYLNNIKRNAGSINFVEDWKNIEKTSNLG